MRAMKDSGIECVGDIPVDWSMRRLRFLCFITTGNQDTQDNDPDGEYPFYVRSPIVERSHKYTFDGPAILMSGDGAGAGRIFHKVSGKYACHQRVYSMQNIHDIDSAFLFYYLRELFPVTLEMANAKSTVDSVRLPMLQDFTVLLPPPAEQQRIAAYLDEQCGEIDKVLAKTRESIEEYKKLKQSVITEAVTKGIRPDRPMKPSGIEWIGDIPEGWTVWKVKNIASKVTDGAHISPETENGVFDFVSTVNLLEDSIDFSHCLKTSERSFKQMVATGCSPQAGDVLISKDGTVGKTVIVQETRDFVVASSLVIIRPIPLKMTSEYLNFVLKSNFVQQSLTVLMQGTGLKRVSVEKNANLIITCPPVDEQSKIVAHLDQQCAEIDRLISKKEQIISELESYKKSLIYECVTGKREVAEKRNLVDIFGKAAKLTAKVAPLADLRTQQISAEAAALSAAKVNFDAIKNSMFGVADKARIQRMLGDISRLTPVSPLPSIQELIPKFELPPIPPVPDSILQSTRWVSGMIEEQRKMFELPPFSKMPDDILQSTRWVSQMIDDQRKMLQPFQTDFKSIAQMLQSTADLIGSLKSFATVHSRITKDWDAIWKNLRLPVVPEIRQKKRAAYKRWAEFGWSCHPNIEFSEIPPESSEIADQFVMQELENYGVDKFIEELSKMVAPNQNEDFESAVFNFKHGYFRTCARVIFSLIDREFIIRQPKEVRPNGKPKQRELAKGAAEIFRKTLDEPETAEKILNRVPRFFYRCENMFYAVITIFESANDFRDEDKTVGLNRNFVDHGMSQRQATKKHCLQLFLLYYNVLGLFSFFDHIWPIKDERWLPTEKNDAESGRDAEDSE